MDGSIRQVAAVPPSARSAAWNSRNLDWLFLDREVTVFEGGRALWSVGRRGVPELRNTLNEMVNASTDGSTDGAMKRLPTVAALAGVHSFATKPQALAAINASICTRDAAP